MFRSREVSQLQGGKNVMLALQTLLEEGKYKLPLPVHKVGNGFDFVGKGPGIDAQGC